MKMKYKNNSQPADVIYLGIGYRDSRVRYFVDKNKADKDEYMTWM